MVFNNVTSQINDTASKHFSDLDVLQSVLDFIVLVDEITEILVKLEIVPKNDHADVVKMLKTADKPSEHPVAGLQTKCIRLLGNMISQNEESVKYFEQNVDKLAVILNHSQVDFVNVGMREQCLLCSKYLIDKSEIIRECLKKSCSSDGNPKVVPLQEE